MTALCEAEKSRRYRLRNPERKRAQRRQWAERYRKSGKKREYMARKKREAAALAALLKRLPKWMTHPKWLCGIGQDK